MGPRFDRHFSGNPLYMTDAVAEFAFPVSFVRSFDEKVVHPLLALWLYGCNAGPGEETIQSQVTARLQAGTDADLFDIRDFAVPGKEERMEGLSGQGEPPAPLQAGTGSVAGAARRGSRL